MKNNQGIGLGLSISKQITEFFGGQMWFESEWGSGTKFSFFFLLEDCEGEINSQYLPEDRIEEKFQIQKVELEEDQSTKVINFNFAMKNFEI